MPKALIVWGGWEGHEPQKVAAIFESVLLKHGFDVELSNSLDAYLDAEKLKELDLIVPHWTMGEIKDEQLRPVLAAVEQGTGIAGCHGGMCDSFRTCTDWQFMTGGNWVSHPGNDGTKYTVHIHESSELLNEIHDFSIVSEQYYLQVDPAVTVHASTAFPVAAGPHTTNGPIDMPVVWTKKWGKGRVFYSSLGHVASVFDTKEALEIMTRGMLWAAGVSTSFKE